MMERSAAMPIETRAVVARYDPLEDRLLVHDSTQAPDRGAVRPGHAVRHGPRTACTWSRPMWAAASA